jgi:glycosyltransferase involved in cell wall biosynthesis
MKNPKVSVCIITYNHKDFIERCLESLAQQQTNFSFEIIVSDDCSTDGSQEIIKRVAQKYPHLIRVFLHEKNMGNGGGNNYMFLHQQAEGTYIAHLDGDDYALPGKLQVQHDYLDQNPGCNVVWHRMYIRKGVDGEMKEDKVDVSRIPAGGFNRGMFLALFFIGGSSSKMYRAKVRDFENPGFHVLDTLTNIEHIGDGYANFVNDNTIYGVYHLGVGITSGGPNKYLAQVLCDTYLYCNKKYPELREYINTGLLFLLAGHMKSMNSTTPVILKAWLKTFHYKSFFHFIKLFSTYKMFRHPRFD